MSENNYYGMVNYKGEEYEVICDAWVDNKGTNGDVVYYAYATKDGKKYRVMWNTTEEFDLSGELLNLECRLQDLQNQKYTQNSEEIEKKEIEERIAELEAQDIRSSYAEDESNACDWDNADDMEEVED